MRIDPKLNVTPITTETRETPAKTASPARPPGTEAAVVALSPEGSRAVDAASTRQKELSQRLEKIKAAIDRGQYPVDLDKLAERIAEDEVMRSRRSS